MTEAGDSTKKLDFSLFCNSNRSIDAFALYGENFPVSEKMSFYAGLGTYTNFKDDIGLAIDGKFDCKFTKNIGIQGRMRCISTPNTNTTQLRVSPYVNQNIGKNTSIYVNPYYAYKIDFNKESEKKQYGIFGGVTQKIGDKVKVFGEGQWYGSKGKYSLNFGGTLTF